MSLMVETMGMIIKDGGMGKKSDRKADGRENEAGDRKKQKRGMKNER